MDDMEDVWDFLNLSILLLMLYFWIFIALLLATQVFRIVLNIWRPLQSQPDLERRPKCTLIMLGSSGHTAEMMSLVEAMNLQWYVPRYYIVGACDELSLVKAQRFEVQLQDFEHTKVAYYSKIYRSRKVNQSIITSFFTIVFALIHAIIQVLRIQPDVILCNGPGTCLPICVVGFLIKFMNWKTVVVVYLESIARIKTLSATGKLLYHFRLADIFLVQWPYLASKYPQVKYYGRVM